MGTACQSQQSILQGCLGHALPDQCEGIHIDTASQQACTCRAQTCQQPFCTIESGKCKKIMQHLLCASRTIQHNASVTNKLASSSICSCCHMQSQTEERTARATPQDALHAWQSLRQAQAGRQINACMGDQEGRAPTDYKAGEVKAPVVPEVQPGIQAEDHQQQRLPQGHGPQHQRACLRWRQ